MGICYAAAAAFVLLPSRLEHLVHQAATALLVSTTVLSAACLIWLSMAASIPSAGSALALYHCLAEFILVVANAHIARAMLRAQAPSRVAEPVCPGQHAERGHGINHDEEADALTEQDNSLVYTDTPMGQLLRLPLLRRSSSQGSAVEPLRSPSIDAENSEEAAIPSESAAGSASVASACAEAVDEAPAPVSTVRFAGILCVNSFMAMAVQTALQSITGKHGLHLSERQLYQALAAVLLCMAVIGSAALCMCQVYQRRIGYYARSPRRASHHDSQEIHMEASTLSRHAEAPDLRPEATPLVVVVPAQ